MDALEDVLGSTEFQIRLKEDPNKKQILQVLLSTINNFGSEENKKQLEMV